MYEEYWGLKERPFDNTPDPRFLYLSREHEEALTRLLYAIQGNKGAAILTGEYGCGKTVLSRTLLSKLDPNRYKTVLITNTQLPFIEFLQEIVHQLGNEKPLQTKVELLHALEEILRRNLSINKNTVIIIDEAQLIPSKEVFEELRLLLNIQLEDRFLFTLLLIGQPELREKMNRLPQLKQRLAIKYHLNPLDREETLEYIIHRLKIAGRKEMIFNEEAAVAIYNHSRGVPRVTNDICDMSLVVGYGRKVKLIDEALTREVIKDLGESW